MTVAPIVLSALYRYPVKSMRGQRLERSPVGPLGLPYDRMWMVADRAGRLVTGRDYPELVLIDAQPSEQGVTLSAPGRTSLFVPNTDFTEAHPATVWGDTFSAWRGAMEAEVWVSDFIGARLRFLWTGVHTARRLRIDESVPLSFADGYPLLIAGQASLDDLSARVGRSMVMERFRPNLVISGAAPFAEDAWKRIRIGGATFRIAKPCERCVFTTVDPETGRKALDQQPLRALAAYRRTPEGVIFGQNLIAEGHGDLRCGMAVEIIE